MQTTTFPISFRKSELLHDLCVNSGLRREVAKNWVLVGYYAASSGPVELHFSGLIGTAIHPYMQKIRLIGYFF